MTEASPQPAMRAGIIPVTPLQQNCSLIWCTRTMRGALVDPGGDLDKLKAAVARTGVTLEKLLVTHGHLDHCGQAGVLASELGLPIEGPHEADRFWISRLDDDGHRWGMDLFHPQALKDMGVQVGTGIAAGAVAGAAVDVMTAGLSLGTGTLVGAAAGGVWQGVERVGKRLMGRARGQREISVDDSVLRLLALRGQTLIQALEQRGHAATQPFALAAPKTLDWQTKPLPAELKEARSRAEWSALSAGFDDDDRRRHVVQTLSEQLSRTATKD